MSTETDSNWSKSRVVPSVIFVLTPCIAISLLVIWSLRMQIARRQWYAEMARRRRSGDPNAIVDLQNMPQINEVWLGNTWDDDASGFSRKLATQESKKTEPQPALEGYVTEQYTWQTIMPVAFSGASKGDGWCDVGVLVRMPSKTPYDDISHTSVTYIELNIAAVEVKL